MDLRKWILDDYDTLDFLYTLTAGRVPKERWSERPFPTASPIAFHVWHMVRWEDVLVNQGWLDQLPVYDEGWAAKLGVGPCPGTGFSESEVDEFAATVSADALDAYWHEVRSRHRRWLEGVPDTELDRIFESVIDMEALCVAVPTLLPEAIAPLAKALMGARNGAEHLRFGTIGHGYMHLGELESVCTALGYPG